MARKVRNSLLDSKTARAALPQRGKPYYVRLAPDLHLGFRRGKKDAKWVLRRYLGGQGYEVETFADAETPTVDADGSCVLNFDQAAARAREIFAEKSRPAPEVEITVRSVVESYVADRDARDSRRKGRAVRSDAGQRLRRYVLGQDKRGKQEAVSASPLASVALHALKEADLLAWREGLPATMKATTRQRLINDLKAALNAAYAANRERLDPMLPALIKHGMKAASGHDDDEAAPLARDNQILSDAQVACLIRAAQEVDAEQKWEGDLCRFVIVLAATGARFSQIARMKVGDVQRAQGRLIVPVSRKGRGGKSGGTPVPVGKDVLDALLPVTTGRPIDAPLLERWRHVQKPGDGIRWERAGRGAWIAPSELARPWQDIRMRAKMPAVIPYALRHSSIVRGIRANLPLRLVAALHDTSTPMIERHYGRWIADGLEELAARAIVPLVPAAGSNVVAIGGAR